jgi:crotonobetainyl-CoA:carnitine CoA-transferase CaiB-like acyl-CoA transferase
MIGRDLKEATASVKETTMTGPLSGIRVLELTTMITGPQAGMLLGDLGAEVIKVENPQGGDPFRTFRGTNYSPHFLAYNRNKKSICLDLRGDNGREAFLRLVVRSDVLLENFRPGVMERLQLSEQVLKEVNSRLIYCSLTGFGHDGPYKDRPAYDAVAQALSGLSSLFLDPEHPQLTGPTISDNMTGIFACYGVLGALLERERTGIARRVDVNMLESTIAFFPDPFMNLTRLGLEQGPLSRVSVSQSYALRCGDRRLISIHLSSPEKFWQGLLQALGREDLAKDVRFATRQKRIDNYLELAAELGKTTQTRERAYWMERLEKHDVPFAPVQTLPEVFDDPQVRHLQTFFEAEHSTEGKVRGIRRPVRFDRARDDQALEPPPVLGQHTEEILRDLGYDASAIARVRASGLA